MIQKIQGIVIHGDALGRTLGFRTANIYFEDGFLGSCVFKVNIFLKGKLYSGMGVNAVWKKMFEVHIFEFNEDIYGQEVEIYILKKIRDNKKFETLSALSEQLKKDKEEIEKIQYNILTFGAFDLVHDGHKYYLSQAKKYGDRLITVVARNTNIEKLKGRKPLYDEQKRLRDVKDMNIADEVILGDEENPMKWLSIYHPEVICLGYDQKGFVEKLSGALEEKNLQTEIITLPAFQPETYKSSLLKNL